MIEINNLNVFYNDFLALNKISVCIEKGAITGIVGPNGAGKSTFLKAVLNVIPHQGEVLIEKDNVKKKLRKIAYVEQKVAIDLSFPIKVKECVSLGTYAEKKVLKKIKKKIGTKLKRHCGRSTCLSIQIVK